MACSAPTATARHATHAWVELAAAPLCNGHGPQNFGFLIKLACLSDLPSGAAAPVPHAVDRLVLGGGPAPGKGLVHPRDRCGPVEHDCSQGPSKALGQLHGVGSPLVGGCRPAARSVWECMEGGPPLNSQATKDVAGQGQADQCQLAAEKTQGCTHAYLPKIQPHRRRAAGRWRCCPPLAAATGSAADRDSRDLARPIDSQHRFADERDVSMLFTQHEEGAALARGPEGVGKTERARSCRDRLPGPAAAGEGQFNCMRPLGGPAGALPHAG